MQILDGKKTAATIVSEISQEILQMKQGGQRVPHLAIVLVGHDGASETYVANKIRMCEQCGMKASLLHFADDASQDEIIAAIEQLNANPDIDGFIVQLPLPAHIDEQKVIEAIDYRKDVDGFHPINVGRLYIGMPCFVCATPKGIMELLRRYNISTRGRKCVVLGRSNIVGKPVAAMLMQKEHGDATVTVLHSHSQRIAEECREAEILVTAIGQPHFIKADMIKEGAVVVDIGITRVPDTSLPKGYRLLGDVDFDNVAPKCSYITPVPGGVGPMTVCMLLLNTLDAAKHTYYQQ